MCLSLFAIPVWAGSDINMADLQRIIEQQQKLLEAQQQQLEAQNRRSERLEQLVTQQQQQLESLQKQVDQSAQTLAEPQEKPASRQQPSDTATATATATATTTTAIAGTGKTPPPADDASRQDGTSGTQIPAPAPADKTVKSDGNDRVKLAISGHVNRMANIVDDGKNTETYFVDNDSSESQVRFIGTAKINEDLTLGTAIELSIAPNKSGNVDQLTQETNNIFDQRKAEISLESKRYGKLWFGKGDTASYLSGAVDLSGTTAISYSTIIDLAGGMFFRERESGELTDLRIGNAFSSWDGLNRRNRLRYDSPKFGGFQFRTSAVSNQRYDAYLGWGGQGYGFKAGSAVAIAEPNEDDSGLQYSGSFSVLHEKTGLNAGLAFGLLERDNEGNSQNYFGKIGWRKSFFSIGDTAFSVDYTRSYNFPTRSDEGYSVGVAAVQQIDDFGVELFGIYRLYSLDLGDEPSVDDINVVSLGARVKF